MSSFNPESNLGPDHARSRLPVSLGPLQRELFGWLHKYAPALADTYMAAVALLQGPDIPGRVTLVCFCMRDLGNILPQARNVAEDRGRFDFGAHARKIVQALGDTSPETVENERSHIPAVALELLADLMRAVAEKTKKLDESGLPKSKGEALANAMPNLDKASADSTQWINEVNEHLKWFGDRHHFSHKPRELPTIEEVANRVSGFERLLVKFTHTFFGLLTSTRQIVAVADARGGDPTAD